MSVKPPEKPISQRLAEEGQSDDVVGHKTMADGSHAPLTRAESVALMQACEAREAKRKADMPTEHDAINAMFEAWQRLKELGWREASYCPKDGSSFDVIEAGSTGIHRCFYSGEWPIGYWMVGEGFDCGPSSPILFRLDPEAEAERKARMEAQRLRYRAVDNETCEACE